MEYIVYLDKDRGLYWRFLLDFFKNFSKVDVGTCPYITVQLQQLLAF
jgi:hypothetical protein